MGGNLDERFTTRTADADNTTIATRERKGSGPRIIDCGPKANVNSSSCTGFVQLLALMLKTEIEVNTAPSVPGAWQRDHYLLWRREDARDGDEHIAEKTGSGNGKSGFIRHPSL
jgi:hypothetical protein